MIHDSRYDHEQVAIGVHTRGNLTNNRGILFASIPNYVAGFLKALSYQDSPSNRPEPGDVYKTTIPWNSSIIYNLGTLYVDV
jgi:hypothetical protein